MTSTYSTAVRRLETLSNHCSLTITDNRTGKTYQISLHSRSLLRPSDLQVIKDADNQPLRSYDPSYTNTVGCVRAT